MEVSDSWLRGDRMGTGPVLGRKGLEDPGPGCDMNGRCQRTVPSNLVVSSSRCWRQVGVVKGNRVVSGTSRVVPSRRGRLGSSVAYLVKTARLWSSASETLLDALARKRRQQESSGVKPPVLRTERYVSVLAKACCDSPAFRAWGNRLSPNGEGSVVLENHPGNRTGGTVLVVNTQQRQVEIETQQSFRRDPGTQSKQMRV